MTQTDEYSEFYKIFNPPDEIWDSLGKYLLDDKAQDFLKKKRYNMKEIKDQTTSRIVNFWVEKGLIDREIENDWLKLSIVDLAWVNIIIKLRYFGVSLEKIKTIKKYLYFFHPSKTIETHLFELFILFAIQKQPVGVAVLEKGEAFLCCEYNFQWAKKKQWTIPSYLYISLNEVVQLIFRNKNLKPIYDIEGVNLSGEEMELLLNIRGGTFQEVKVRLKNGSIVLFEGKQKIEATTRIIEILKSSDYQDIQLTAVNGKVVNIVRTEKKKF